MTEENIQERVKVVEKHYEDLSSRLWGIKMQWAFLAGVLATAVVACVIFMGVEYYRVPALVQREVDLRIGEDTLATIEDAKEKAEIFLSDTIVYGYVHQDDPSRNTGMTSRWTSQWIGPNVARIELDPPMPGAVMLATAVNESNRIVTVNPIDTTNPKNVGRFFEVKFYTVSEDNKNTHHDVIHADMDKPKSSFSFLLLPGKPGQPNNNASNTASKEQ